MWIRCITFRGRGLTLQQQKDKMYTWDREWEASLHPELRNQQESISQVLMHNWDIPDRVYSLA